MKGKKEDKMIRELFRQKLEYTEIVPGESVRTELMNKLGRREFLRFNPRRFNVYYLGAFLVAGITAVLILTTEPDKNKNELIPARSEKTDITVLKDSLPDYKSKSTSRINEYSLEKGKPPAGRTLVTKYFQKTSSTKPVRDTVLQSRNSLKKSDISTTLSKKGLLTEPSPEKNNLKSFSTPVGTFIGSSVTSGCVPLKVLFRINSLFIDSCQWTFGDGGYSNKKDPEWIFDIEGEYEVGLIVFTPEGSKELSSSIITVYPKPVARFEFSPENPVIPEDEIRFINYSTNALKCSWEFGDGKSSDLFEPHHRYQKFGNYDIRLVVTSEYGCSDSLLVQNAYSGSGYYIEFPNAFIPNSGGPSGGYYSSKSDESAQIFHPEISGVSDYQLRIFSKRGILIFESRDVNIGWDGYYNGQLSEPGVYIWKVRGNFVNGEPFIKMGDITLLKIGQ